MGLCCSRRSLKRCISKRSSLVSVHQLLEQNCRSTGLTASLTCVSILNAQNTDRTQERQPTNPSDKKKTKTKQTGNTRLRASCCNNITLCSQVTSWQKPCSPMVTAGNTYHTFAGACMCCHILSACGEGRGEHSIKALHLPRCGQRPNGTLIFL